MRSSQSLLVVDIQREGRKYSLHSFWYQGDRLEGHMSSLILYSKKEAETWARSKAMDAVLSGEFDVARVTRYDQASLVAEYR